MRLTAYQRRLVTYVKGNHPCYPKRKTKGMSKKELSQLEVQADGNAIAWLDEWMPRWREGSPPPSNPIYVTVRKDDKDEDDEY